MNRKPLGLTLPKAILGFQQYKTAEALSPNTLVSYESALKLWLSHAGDVDLNQITSKDILEYLAWLRTEYKPRRLGGRMPNWWNAWHPSMRG
jgi:integrase/recombinase XerD